MRRDVYYKVRARILLLYAIEGKLKSKKKWKKRKKNDKI